MRRLARESAGYLGVSVIALGADVATLTLLVRGFAVPSLAAACLSFGVGLLVSYVLSVTWVFKQRRLKQRPLEFASFAALGGFGFVVNVAVMSVAVRLWGLHYLLAKGIAAGCTFVCNFASRRQLLFTTPLAPAGSGADV